MEWSEFMQYVINAVGSSAVPSAEPGKYQESVMQMLEKEKANHFNWFYMAQKPIDKQTHNNYISK